MFFTHTHVFFLICPIAYTLILASIAVQIPLVYVIMRLVVVKRGFTCCGKCYLLCMQMNLCYKHQHWNFPMGNLGFFLNSQGFKSTHWKPLFSPWFLIPLFCQRLRKCISTCRWRWYKRQALNQWTTSIDLPIKQIWVKKTIFPTFNGGELLDFKFK